MLFICQSLGGVCSILRYTARDSLVYSICILAAWSIIIPMACGATFGIVPFVREGGGGGGARDC